MNPKQVLETAKKNNVVMVDLKFTDWPGMWQHCSYPIGEIDELTFEEGLGFDGSSVEGYARIYESDLVALPDISTFQLLPWEKDGHVSARMFCDVERTVSLVQAALRALDEGDPEASLIASAAKAMASATARHVTEEALQLYGGLGMTEEQDIGLYFKRARVSSALFGDANDHYRRIAQLSGF